MSGKPPNNPPSKQKTGRNHLPATSFAELMSHSKTVAPPPAFPGVSKPNLHVSKTSNDSSVQQTDASKGCPSNALYGEMSSLALAESSNLRADQELSSQHVVMAFTGFQANLDLTFNDEDKINHILANPIKYLGSIALEKQKMWIYDKDLAKVVKREIEFSPALFTLFDNVLMFLIRNKNLTPSMKTISVNFDRANSTIELSCDGKVIPDVESKINSGYILEKMFGSFFEIGNLSELEQRRFGNRSAIYPRFCNIFSSMFSIQAQTTTRRSLFKQTWNRNMMFKGEAIVTPSDSIMDSTRICFQLDFNRFGQQKLENETIALLSKRVFDMSIFMDVSSSIYIDHKKLKVHGFESYVRHHTENRYFEDKHLKTVFVKPNKCFEVGLTVSLNGFEQTSFVTKFCTNNGGIHTDFVVNEIASALVFPVEEMFPDEEISIEPQELLNYLWVFINCAVENPKFESKMNTRLIGCKTDFQKDFKLDNAFIKEVIERTGIIEIIKSKYYKKKSNADDFMEVDDEMGSSKICRPNIPHLKDAIFAGSNQAAKCRLVLTEGLSARTTAICGLSVVGEKYYGVYALQGTMLNVESASKKSRLNNHQINNLMAIIGLEYSMKYETDEELKTLRYGSVMLMFDADEDAYHLSALFHNFILKFWPALNNIGFVSQFVTPILKAVGKKGGHGVVDFFTADEFNKWKMENPNWNKNYNIKPFFNLAASTPAEAQEYFERLTDYTINFEHSTESKQILEMFMSPSKADQRKLYLTKIMSKRSNNDHSEVYAPGSQTIGFKTFIDKGLTTYSTASNIRNIPSFIDGFKSQQRRIFFVGSKYAKHKQRKVVVLSAEVIKNTEHHNDPISLSDAIIRMAQDFVGCPNNVSLFIAIGQFGTRLSGGDDAGQPRYIYILLSLIAEKIFRPEDLPVLYQKYDMDGEKIEPKVYCPIVPLILLNGAHGIGSGWSTFIPKFGLKQLIYNLKKLIHGKDQQPMTPTYKNFTGKITSDGDQSFICLGTIRIDGNKAHITELPIGVWTNNYAEELTKMRGDPSSPVSSFENRSTFEKINFVVTLKQTKIGMLTNLDNAKLCKIFKLVTTISTSNMHVFNSDGHIQKFETPEEILAAFFEIRKQCYIRRIYYQQKLLAAKIDRVNQQLQITERQINRSIEFRNKNPLEIVATLKEHGFVRDPIETFRDEWRLIQLDEQPELSQVPDFYVNPDERERVNPFHYWQYLTSQITWRAINTQKGILINRKIELEKEAFKMNVTTWQQIYENELNELKKSFFSQIKKKKVRRDPNINFAKSTDDLGVSQISYQRKRRNTDPVVYLPVVNQMELPHTIQTHDDVPFSVGKFRKTDQVSSVMSHEAQAKQVKLYALNQENEMKRMEWKQTQDRRNDAAVEESKRTLFVGNLPLAADELDLQRTFEEFGRIAKSRVVRNHFKVSRRYGFIVFKREGSVEEAVKEAKRVGILIGTRNLVVKYGVLRRGFLPKRLRPPPPPLPPPQTFSPTPPPPASPYPFLPMSTH